MLGALGVSAASKEEEAKKAAENLKHKDAKVRLQAVKELGKLGSASLKLVTPYISQLTEAIKDKDVKLAAPRTVYYIQAGAFQTAADADNLKAKLALMQRDPNALGTILQDKRIMEAFGFLTGIDMRAGGAGV